MIAVLQRVKKSKVVVDGNIVGEIWNGLNILLGVANEDEISDAEFLTKKIAKFQKIRYALQELDLEIHVYFFDSFPQIVNRDTCIKKKPIMIIIIARLLKKVEKYTGTARRRT